MHILTVIAHPDPNSFSHAVADEFNKGAIEARHTVEIADLHQEGFDPSWSMADVNQRGGDTTPKDIVKEQARIERCDAVCMVYPLFWYAMPSMLKGWVDRVFSWGWAYDQLEDPNLSLLKDRSCVMLIPAGATPEDMKKYNLEENMDAIWTRGTLGYFGFSKSDIHILYGSTGSEERRENLLNNAYQAGQNMS